MPTFDGETLIMTLDAPTDSVLIQDVELDWYNAWKDWMLESPLNRKYPPVFLDSFGGNTLTPSIDAGAYFVFQNSRGWRMRSAEFDQTVYVGGNVAPSDSSLPITIPTIGGHTVMYDGLQPVTQNVDAILDDQQAATQSTQRLIESLRPHHTGYGNIYYWGPYAGDDANDGLLPENATKTFAQAHTLASDNNHDIIICLPDDPSGTTTTTENIAITKDYLFVRGPGRDFVINSANDSLDAIAITGNGVEVSSMTVSTSATNTKHCIHSSANFTLIKDVWISGAVNGVHLENGEYSIVDNVKAHHNLGHGLKISGTSDHVDIIDCHIGSNTLDNVVIDIDASTHEVNFLGNNVIHSSVTGYGLNISANTKSVIIGDQTLIMNNFAGDVNDNSTNTYDARLESLGHIERVVWIDTELALAGNGTQHSPFNNLTAAIDFAELHGLKRLKVFADITLDRQLKNFIIEGVGVPTVNCNGQTLTKSEFRHCQLEGTYTGPIIAQECKLLTGFTINGNFETCALAGDLTCADGSSNVMTQCVSGIPGLSRPTISMNGAGTVLLNLRKYSGGMTIKDCNTAGDTVTAEIAEGSLTFDASCTDGNMVARGMCKFVDSSNGATVTDETGFPAYLNLLYLSALTVGKFIALGKALFKGKDDK